jgi:gamma-glutamyltranspeptidase/glutathione hydrolase
MSARRLTPLLLLLPLLACHAPPLRLAYRPGQVTLATNRGMVVSEAPLASAVGADVLARGGSAADAAVATAFALAVTEPQASPIGGGGFAVIAPPDEEPAALDFRETAPARAAAAMFLAKDGTVDRAIALRSVLSAGTPGGVAGLAELHRRAGRLPWASLVEPAIALARAGFEIRASLADALNDARKKLAADPDAAAIFVRDRPWRPGDLLVQTDLARTLEAIRDRGSDGFAAGPVAAAIAAKVAAGKGVLDAADLAAYRPVWRTPARFSFRGHEVVTMPLPSSAGVVLPLMLGILDAAGGQATRPMSADRLHLLAEASRRAFAERNDRLGDPAGVPDGLVEKLVSPASIAERARTVDLRATPSFQLDVWRERQGETTHLCVVDGRGGAVAMTVSLNTTFGSGIVAGGTGVLLNDHMDDFTLRPGERNAYGLRQGEANALVPGRRPLSSMAPTVVLRDGEPVLVLGAAGGPRILSAVAQVLLHEAGDGLALETAALLPRIHHQHRPDELRVEDAVVAWPAGGERPDLLLSARKLDDLRRRGHFPAPRNAPIGRLTAISRDPETGDLRGVAGPRTDGAAVAEPAE